MAVQWFVQLNGNKFGPMPAAQLKELAASGKLKPSDQVQKEGMSNFVPAETVKGLFPVASATKSVAPRQPSSLDEGKAAVSNHIDQKARSPRRKSGNLPLVLIGVGSAGIMGLALAVGVVIVVMANTTPQSKDTPKGETAERGGDQAKKNEKNSAPAPGDGDKAAEQGAIPDHAGMKEKEAGGSSGVKDGPQVSIESQPGGKQKNRSDPNRDDPITWRPGVAVSNSDDSLLLRAGVTINYHHNRILVDDEGWPQHADLVTRFADAKNDERRARFAKTIIAKDYVAEEFVSLLLKNAKLNGGIPNALNRSKANNVLKTLLGREPTWHELLNENVPGGFVSTMDKIRETKVAATLMEIYLHLLNSSITDQAESHYRKVLGDRLLPQSARLFVKKKYFSHRTQISHAGTQPLMNVVVVTRTTMKSSGAKAVANKVLINGINEMFDPGADRNKVAAQLLEALRM